MSNILRQDLGVRLAMEKGQLPDEGLTRMQLQPGNNIYFEYASNWDIIIHANVPAGGGGGAAARRMMTGELSIDNFYSAAFNESAADLHVAVLDKDNGTAEARRFYGTAKFKDIHHNWKLSTKDAFLITIIDERTGVSGPYSIHSIPKVVAINDNTIRIFVTDIPSLTPNIATPAKSVPTTFASGTSASVDVGDVSGLRVGMRLVNSTYINDVTFITAINYSTGDLTLSQDTKQTGGPLNTDYKLWEANEDTDLIRTSKGAYEAHVPYYRFTLQEYS